MRCIELKEDDGSLFAIYGPFESEKQAGEWLEIQDLDGLVACVVQLWHPLTPVSSE